MNQYKKALFMIIELFLRIVISPFLRAYLLKICGAKIGRNVRIYEVHFLNLSNGFSNLYIEDDVHIGMGCRIDLEGAVHIHRGATISLGVTILSHYNPGEQHNSPLCKEFPPVVGKVDIGNYCWIGCNTTILAGSIIPERTAVGACSLVKGRLEANSVYLGIPAKKIRDLKTIKKETC